MKINKSIIIDIKSLKITQLNLNHILTLLKIQFYLEKDLLNYKVNQDDILYLCKEGYILLYDEKIKSQKYYLREKGKVTLSKIVKVDKENYNEEIVIENISEKDEIEDFNILVNKFRYKFKNLKIGSMGNPKAVSDKLKRWMKNNPEITRKEILDAVNDYIESLNGDYRYLQRADYFIYKQNNKKEETSRLSLYIEEGRKEVVNSDWTTSLT